MTNEEHTEDISTPIFGRGIIVNRKGITGEYQLSPMNFGQTVEIIEDKVTSGKHYYKIQPHGEDEMYLVNAEDILVTFPEFDEEKYINLNL